LFGVARPSFEGLTAGPLLLPGRPGVPAPEFALLGVDADGGGAFCAKAGAVTNGSRAKMARARMLFLRLWSPDEQPRLDRNVPPISLPNAGDLAGPWPWDANYRRAIT
jgi:hypothetical protein